MTETSQESDKLVLCPYCGHAQYGGDRCQACGGLFEPLSRKATQLAMGPWQVRSKDQPFRPGFCYDVLKGMAKSGKIKPTTVMRGPTTKQFWSVARNVPGVSHLVGYCHACGNHVSPSDAKCGECQAIFEEPRERDSLGLAYKTDEEAVLGQKMLDAEMRGEAAPSRQVPGPTKKPRPAKTGDLLSDVLDLSGAGEAARGGGEAVRVRPRSDSAAAQPIGFVSAPAGGPGQAPTSAFDVEPTSELPDGGGVSTLGLIMIMLNIVAIAAIVVLWIMLR